MAIEAVGLDIAKMFYSTIDSIIDRADSLETKIDDLTKTTTTTDPTTGESVTTSSISQEEMLMIQFEIGQYNAMVEMLSSISKSLTDMMKTLAQRSS
ncbi:MAG: type III secretion protein [Mailhella sp.]|nr:type III secretion protein [Mailhella sp.]